MTEQEVFDKVKAHLLQQNSKALHKGGGCAYKAEDGKKCAVGCLIPDELYQERFENLGISQLLEEATKLRALLEGVDTVLLMDLMLIHDTKDPIDWPECLNNLAEAHALD